MAQRAINREEVGKWGRGGAWRAEANGLKIDASKCQQVSCLVAVMMTLAIINKKQSVVDGDSAQFSQGKTCFVLLFVFQSSSSRMTLL